MKILGISGGMRNGSNDGMCIEALMGAKEMGAEVEFIQLQGRRWSFASIWRRRKREVCSG